MALTALVALAILSVAVLALAVVAVAVLSLEIDWSDSISSGSSPYLHAPVAVLLSVPGEYLINHMLTILILKLPLLELCVS